MPAPQVSVKDVPLDEDLAELFGDATHAEFQSLILLVQLNRRLARMEGKETPLEEGTQLEATAERAAEKRVSE